MLQDSDFRVLLADLYAGVQERDRLFAFMARLGTLTQSHTIGFTRRDHSDRTGSAVEMVGLASQYDLARYEAEFVGTSENLWFERAFPTVRTGSIVNGDTWATKAEVKRTRYHADFLRSIDTMHSVALCGFMSGPRTAILSLCRSERTGAYDADALALLHELSPHWVNAYALLTQHEQLLLPANSLTHAVFGLDSALRWISGNDHALQVLSAGWLRGQRGRTLEPVSPITRHRWIAALRSLASPRTSNSAPIPIYDRDGYLVAFATVRSFGAHAPREGMASYVVYVRSLRRNCAGDLKASLRSLFDLTEAEARLVTALLVHSDLAAAASAVDIVETTARTRMHAVFQKTGTHKQAELLRLVEVLSETLS